MKEVFVSANRLRTFILDVLLKANVRSGVARFVAEGLVQTSLRGVDSHGIRLFPHYLRGVKGGRINPNPKYKFTQTAPSTALLDADHTFGHAAGMEAAKRAIELATEAGTGHIAIYNSSHFGAAAYYALEIAKNDMIGVSFTNTDALVMTFAGKRPFLGNNPICFAAPCKDEEPFCLDMATSVVTFNKIRQLREERLPAPLGVGANKDGVETTNPNEITTLLPISGYKGYGLSMVVEILCGLLTGMPYGPHIPKMFEAPMSQKRFLGQFIIAMRIDCFQDKEIFKKRLSEMMKEVRNEPRFDKNIPIQVAGDPEKRSYTERCKNGIPLKLFEHGEFKKISEEYGIPFN
ncbi:MAG TPA: Ldh family oxidoreductase [Candidatus Wujingus californicus]|uniref:Ldh family oxidoreductase n=1 Tax=Candidatus Wujingus californicus TaxID=3367618 RepID=UPI00402928A8